MLHLTLLLLLMAAHGSESQQQLGKSLVATTCGATITNDPMNVTPRVINTWRISSSERNRRLVVAVEYYGATWQFRALKVNQFQRALPISRSMNLLGFNTDSNGQIIFNCTKQWFAIFSASNSQASNYRLPSKLLAHSCDDKNLEPLIVMSQGFDETLIVEYTLSNQVSNTDNIARFVATVWPVEKPPGSPTAPPTTPTTTARPTTTTTTRATTTTKPTTTATPRAPTTTSAASSSACQDVKVQTSQTRTAIHNRQTFQRDEVGMSDFPFIVQLRYAQPPAATTTRRPSVIPNSGVIGQVINAINIFRGKRQATRSNMRQYAFECSGILIHPSWVIASKTCIPSSKASPQNWIVVADGTTTGASDSFRNYVAVSNINTNARLSASRKVDENLALIKLAAPLNVPYACLPRSSYNPANGTACFAVGWDVSSGKMTGLSVEFVRRPQCESRQFNNAAIGSQRFCAIQPPRTECLADSEVLICPVSSTTDTFQLAGIALPGQCGRQRKPSLFLKIPAYVDWILSASGGTIPLRSNSVNSRILEEDDSF